MRPRLKKRAVRWIQRPVRTTPLRTVHHYYYYIVAHGSFCGGCAARRIKREEKPDALALFPGHGFRRGLLPAVLQEQLHGPADRVRDRVHGRHGRADLLPRLDTLYTAELARDLLRVGAAPQICGATAVPMLRCAR